MSRADLDRVREWATKKLAACQEPLNAGHQYMKLLQSLDNVLAKIDSGRPPWDRSLRPMETATLNKSAWSKDSCDTPRAPRSVSV